MMSCPYCRRPTGLTLDSDTFGEVRCPHPGCRRFLLYRAHPSGPDGPAQLLTVKAMSSRPGLAGDEPLPQLTGAAGDIERATPIRRERLAVWAPHLPPEAIGALRTVRAAGWWIENRHSPSSALTCPHSWLREPERRANAREAQDRAASEPQERTTAPTEAKGG